MAWLFVIFLLNGVIPTKWLPVWGIPAGDIVICGIYVAFAGRVLLLERSRHLRSPLIKLWLGCLMAVAVSAGLSFFAGGDRLYWFWVMKQVVHYLFVFPLIALVRTNGEFQRCLRYFLVTALLAAGALHVYGQFPELADADLGTGTKTGTFESSVRIYTVGSTYVLLAAVGLIPYLVRGFSYVAAWLFLLSGLVATYGRSFFAIIGICVVLYLGRAVIRKPVLQVTKQLLFALVLVFVTAQLVPQEALAGVLVRMQTLAELATVPLRDFDTLGWRILDAETAIAQVQTPWEVFAGVFSRPYLVGGLLYNNVHIGWVGLYYHFGLLGVSVFGVLSLWISVKVLGMLRRAKQMRLPLGEEQMQAFALVWVALCLFGFIGGMFVSGPSIIALALLCHGISLTENRVRIEEKRKKFGGNELRAAQVLRHHALP